MSGAGPEVDAVVIGRNEGERLSAALGSLAGGVRRIIYVDSGSQDDSVARAEALGAEVVNLDMTQPFTAARARNAGFAALGKDAAEFVQFIDGDCSVVAGWIDAARAALVDEPALGLVCGRRRERQPEASVYNRLIDREWDTPVGETRACGGDFMVRHTAFAQVGGFDAGLIAGEEPELCLRLRRAGWRLWRLDAEMTAHDAALTRFGQWWRRARRAGFAFAEGAARYGFAPERHWLRETLRAVVWGLGLPLAGLLGALWSPWTLLLWLAYPAQVLRLWRKGLGADWAFFTVLSKFPEAQGVLGYWWRRLRRGEARLIEYK
ncbi:glycosyltransferase family 2 protein [Roseovarius nubinhibens]|mgnify:FL=1|uniref:Glycosyl transferase n=1 Tax=Roseovarius nubinhibens TaxID=314263 RepID=A0A348WB93_9RHOB|nr:glycosyl transferase [Roseovarius nubinhibens]